MPEATEPVQITRPKAAQNMGVKYITPFLFVHFLLLNKKMDSSQGRAALR